MASQAPSQLLRRVALSAPTAQRCGCSIVAGPSVARRVQKDSRSLHISARVKQQGFHSHRVMLAQTDNAASPFIKRQASTSVAASSSAEGSQGQSISMWSEEQAVERMTNQELEDSATGGGEGEQALPKLPSFSFARPPQHPLTNRELVCTLRLSSYGTHRDNLDFYTQFCVHAAYAFGLPCSLPQNLPTKTSLRTVPRSPFVHKPSQENFIKKEHKRLLKIHDADINAVGQWLDYINENSLGGVRMTAKLYEPVSLGFGADMIADAKDLEPSGMEKVKELADKILASGFGQEKAEEPEQQNKPRSGRQTKTETEKESLQGTDSK